MEELFANFEPKKESKAINVPLADRMRPQTIDDIVGQEHLFGEDAPLRGFIESKAFPSIILWGPPGVGKTTFAHIIAKYSGYYFTRISAVESGVKELREIIQNAEKISRSGKKFLLFIDEIHRFNKSQQDALLHSVESGLITLIGATTENPSFEVNSALLSRCRVYRLNAFTSEHLKTIISRAVRNDQVLSNYNITIEDLDFLCNISGGDARSALNALESAFYISNRESKDVIITKNLIEKALQRKTLAYDKKGENHYDTVSAFIKSLRGSDPDAALIWMAKMLNAGEDPKFIARRMVIFASEDIGNADPQALQVAVSVFNAVNLIGMPECTINLGQACTYLASAPKSNSSYRGIKDAMQIVNNSISITVPMHLRNAPTTLMKDIGYGEAYQYPHDYDGHFVQENYFPTELKPISLYKPGDNGKEADIKKHLAGLWQNRYKEKE